MSKRTGVWIVIMLVSFYSPLFGSLEDDISISLEEKQVQDLSLDGLSMVFYVNISNTSSKTYYLSGYRYRFMVNNQEYLRLQVPLGESLKIEASRKTLIALPVKITYEFLFREISEVKKEDIVQCYMMGEFAFSDGRKERGRLPVAFSGEFPIFKSPEIEISALKANTLTIGGADLNFGVKIKNKNGYELEVENVSYDIKFGGHQIENGRLSEDKNIPKNDEIEISFPLLLNFFEVGKDVLAILQQDSLNCHFSGKIDINTLWGRLSISVDKKEKVNIQRSENENQRNYPYF